MVDLGRHAQLTIAVAELWTALANAMEHAPMTPAMFVMGMGHPVCRGSVPEALWIVLVHAMGQQLLTSATSVMGTVLRVPREDSVLGDLLIATVIAMVEVSSTVATFVVVMVQHVAV